MDPSLLESSSRSKVESSTSQSSTSLVSCGVGVKIGGLWKRSQGISRFTKPNYKHRVFILTDQSLSYYGGTVDRVGQQKGRVELASIRAVEYVDTSAFYLAHTFQIVYHSKKNGFVKLYVTAADKTQAADWISALRQVCYFNQDMLMHYHPGAYIKNKWTCCKQTGQVMLGCQPTYYLLTRSSSRYAQMRRKDTLTNRTQRAHAATEEAIVDCHSGSVFDDVGTLDKTVKGYKPGRGLSNSCINLAIHPPNRVESFMESPMLQRGGRFSAGDSLLTRVSFASSEDGPMICTSSQSLKRLSRSKVAPEVTPVPIDFPKVDQLSGKRTNSETELLSVSNGYTVVWEHNSSPPPPIPPPRQKRGQTKLTQSHSIHFVPRVSRISEVQSQSKVRSPLKYSNTFVVQRYHNKKGEFSNKINRGLSRSMSALSKPKIEPKVSSTNPNIIHV